MLAIERSNQGYLQSLMMLGLLLASFVISFSILSIVDPQDKTANRGTSFRSSEAHQENKTEGSNMQLTNPSDESTSARAEQSVSTAHADTNESASQQTQEPSTSKRSSELAASTDESSSAQQAHSTDGAESESVDYSPHDENILITILGL